MQGTKRFAGARSLTRSDSSCGAAVAAVVVVAHGEEGGTCPTLTTSALSLGWENFNNS